MIDADELERYAKAHSLTYVWEGTTAYIRRLRTLQPDQYEIRPVRTRGGRKVTNALLFSLAIKQREDEAMAVIEQRRTEKRIIAYQRAERAEREAERERLASIRASATRRDRGSSRRQRHAPGRPA